MGCGSLSWLTCAGSRSTSSGQPLPSAEPRRARRQPIPSLEELRALRRLQREEEPKSPFVFTSERGSPFTTAGFARLVERAGTAAELRFKASPAHAQARLWLCASQQGARYAGSAGLPWPQEHPAHGSLYRAVAGSVQELLAMTTYVCRRI